jgi:hypothetical protein
MYYKKLAIYAFNEKKQKKFGIIWSFVILGERYVYKFVCDPEALFQMAVSDSQRSVAVSIFY